MFVAPNNMPKTLVKTTKTLSGTRASAEPLLNKIRHIITAPNYTLARFEFKPLEQRCYNPC
jgi:hypothetical protein